MTSKEQEEVVFTKRVAKSGRGLLVWIPKDVSDFMRLDGDSVVEIKIKKLGGKK